MKRLTRSQTNKVIGGVLGGFAEYTNVDPTVIRLAYVLITLFSCFVGILFYIIAWIIVPMKGETEKEKIHHKETSEKTEEAETEKEVIENNDEELKVEDSTEEKL